MDVRSSYDVRVVDAVSDEYSVRSELADQPTEEDVMEAMAGPFGGKPVDLYMSMKQNAR